MEIIFSFPNDRINFDCETCSAVCCHVNNYLLMNDKQYAAAKYYNPIAAELSNKNGNSYYLRAGKQCWFLKNHKCLIHENQGKEMKPQSCSVYPLKVWLLRDNLAIVDYIPCPDFFIKESSINSIKHSEYRDSIVDYIKLTDSSKLSNQSKYTHKNITSERLLYEQEFRDNFDQHLNMFLNESRSIFNNLSLKERDFVYKYLWLYPQLRMRPSVLSLPIKWSLITFQLYFKIIIDSSKIDWGDGNYQNAYAAILNKFNIEMSKRYSFERR